MMVSFPHMGNTYITIKALMDDLDVPYLMPPQTSRRTLELGARYVPEGACLPLKITTGNLIEACEMGADIQMMIGSGGPCRFGYYCQMQREVLQDVGLTMEPLYLDVTQGYKTLIRRIKNITNGASTRRVTHAVIHAARIAKAVDELERLYRVKKAREIRLGSSEAVYGAFLRDVLSAHGSLQIRNMLENTKRDLLSVAVDEDKKPLKIGLVGEIYGTIDAWTNLRLEARLGDMGVEVERMITVSDWIASIVKKALHINRIPDFVRAAQPYIKADIGGHTRETLGHTVLHARQGFDGVIQLYPLGCMPEIVAESILPEISGDYDLPILTLVMDEMTGEAGIMTRIEAFIDLLNQRRELQPVAAVQR